MPTRHSTARTHGLAPAHPSGRSPLAPIDGRPSTDPRPPDGGVWPTDGGEEGWGDADNSKNKNHKNLNATAIFILNSTCMSTFCANFNLHSGSVCLQIQP